MSAIIILGLVAFMVCLIATPIVRNIFLRANLVDHPDADRKFHLSPIPASAESPSSSPTRPRWASSIWSRPTASISTSSTAICCCRSCRPPPSCSSPDFWTTSSISAPGRSSSAKLRRRARGRSRRPYDHPARPRLDGVRHQLRLAHRLRQCAQPHRRDGRPRLWRRPLRHPRHHHRRHSQRQFGLAVATVPLAACLFAFLRYNFHPATIFLGDCGSLTIGFMLGCFGLIWSQRTGTIHGMAAPLMALALPLIDVALAIGRRFLRSVPIFQGDRGHIHHMMLARGLTTRAAVLVLYGVCGTASLLALLLSFSAHQFKWVIATVFCLLAIIGINHLRYVELSALLRSFSRKSMLRLVQEEIYLHELECALALATTMETFWGIVCTACEDLRFATVQIRLHGKQFHQVMEAADTNSSWRLTVPLGAGGEMTLTRAAEAIPPRLTMAVIERLQNAVQQRELTRETVEDTLSQSSLSFRGAA